MRIAVAADERVGVAAAVLEELRRRGHEPIAHGALAEGERDDWAWASEAAARDVAEGRAEQAIVCCWTGTGASIAANKVAGVRAALCADAATADGARRWNDANVLALSLRTTSEAELSGDPRRLVRGRAVGRGRRPRQRRAPGAIERGALTVPVRRLLPERGETTVADQVAGARPGPARARPDRPYLVTNFALTLDGHATIAGRSGPIGTATDTAMLVGLRTRVDAVMIGAGTMRAESYGRVIADPAKRERREREGLAPDPLVVIVSGRLDLPWDAPLFTEGFGRCLICTSSEVDPPETTTAVEVLRQRSGGRPAGAARAPARRARRPGPALRGRAASARASCSTPGWSTSCSSPTRRSSPAAHGPGLVAGLSELERPLELAWLLADEASGELFGRYRVPRG